jgi:hypothetical protein
MNAIANRLPAAKAQRMTTVVVFELVCGGATWYPTAKAADHRAVESERKANALLSGAFGARLNTYAPTHRLAAAVAMRRSQFTERVRAI